MSDCFCCYAWSTLLLLAYYQGFFDNGRLDFIMQSRLGPVINNFANVIWEAGNVMRQLLERLLGSPL